MQPDKLKVNSNPVNQRMIYSEKHIYKNKLICLKTTVKKTFVIIELTQSGSWLQQKTLKIKVQAVALDFTNLS